MKTVVVYDSLYGNTEAVARAVGAALPGDVQVVRVGQVNARDLEDVDLLVVGSPTHGALASEATRALLDKLGAPARAGARAAAFDTRFGYRIAGKWGFAASKIAEALQARGWTLVGEPAGFVIKGLKNGPLKPGEVERAAAWAKTLS